LYQNAKLCLIVQTEYLAVLFVLEACQVFERTMTDGVYIEELQSLREPSVEMTSVRIIDDQEELQKDIAKEYVFVSIYLTVLVFLLVLVCCITRRARRTRRTGDRSSISHADKPPSYQNLFFSDPLPEYESLADTQDDDDDKNLI
jgi:hypothetical protein